MTLSYQERIERILNTSHIIVLSNWHVYRVETVYQLGSIIFIDTGGVHYQDTEVLTLEEAGKGESFCLRVKEILNINY